MRENFSTISMSKRLIKEIQSKMEINFGDTAYVPGWAKSFGSNKRDYLGMKGGKIRLLFVSTIEDHKGVFLALEALSHLSTNEIDRISLDVYGSGSTERLLRDIGKHSLSPYVRYLGTRTKNEVLKLYQNYDFLLFPTWEREPFGFVAAEAAINGCIPIITDGTGASEYLEDGKDSIFISRDIDGIIEGLRKALDLKSSEIQQFKANCRASAGSKFNEHELMQIISRLTASLSSKQWAVANPQKIAKTLMLSLDSFY